MSMKQQNALKIKGHFKAKVYENGQVIQEIDRPNLVVNVGLASICFLLGGSGVGLNINKVAFGSNNVPVDPADTQVGTMLDPPFIKAVDAITHPAQNQVRFDWALELSENNGNDVYEYALYGSNGSTIFAKVVFPLIQKTSLIRIEGIWIIEISTN